MIFPVILSGGSGTRLWPLSRENQPKQLLALGSPLTMLQETARRLDGFASDGEVCGPLIAVCNSEYRFSGAYRDWVGKHYGAAR
jgi:mannose-1-phosphate guanylyltransferase / mannose-6-phosphate isomerase